MIKQLLETQIREQIPTRKCAVLLSGGVDSLSVALAAYNVGIKVIAYSFHLDGNESYDFKTAQKFLGTIILSVNIAKKKEKNYRFSSKIENLETNYADCCYLNRFIEADPRSGLSHCT